MKRLGVGLAILFAIILLIPAIVIWTADDPESEQQQLQQQTLSEPVIPLPSSLDRQIPISVYRTQAKTVEIYPIEEYITGVVAAEMPADFELEALKAQAMAARTYIVRRIAEKDFSDVPEGAYVSDTIQHQVYLDEEQRRRTWGKDYSWKIDRIRQAVVETQGQVLTFKGRPINATFFSTSNGYTENSEEYWVNEIPYLRSVEVPWDKNSPRYQVKTSILLTEVERKLGIKLTAEAISTGKWMQVLETTTGNRIGKVKIGDKVYTGRELREKLDLHSSSFLWEIIGGKLHLTTFGYGHGVGMSQWGAHGMAQAGKKAAEIVKYFYQGIAIEDYRQWVKY
jgi:stage II sporulation protein D